MKNWYYLAGLAVVTALMYYIYGSKEQAEPISYEKAIDLTVEETAKNSYFYLVKLEYKTKEKIPVQFEKVTGLPEPPPGFVEIDKISYHEGVYKWSGKPFKAFYDAIIQTIDTTAVFYRKIDIRQQ